MNSTPSLPDADPQEALKLPASGDTASAQDLRVHLVMQLDGPGPLAIDASEVEHAGQAMLQLLVAAHDAARAADKPFTIINPSPAFGDRVKRCGLNGRIGLAPEGADA